MSKREQQLEMNEHVYDIISLYNAGVDVIVSKQLRYCNATVYTCTSKETGEVLYVLRSYNTIVAIISGNCAYDFLRLVYGYTATSAEHIANLCMIICPNMTTKTGICTVIIPYDTALKGVSGVPIN